LSGKTSTFYGCILTFEYRMTHATDISGDSEAQRPLGY
jgi:hypothetical protein